MSATGQYRQPEGARSGERPTWEPDAVAALEDAVWARAGEGDPALHQRLQHALAELRERRRSQRSPERPGLLSRILHNPIAVLTPVLALMGVAWQQLSAAHELAQQEALAKREIRLSLIHAYIEADDTDQRLSVLETSKTMPSVMGPCSPAEANGVLAGLFGYAELDCEARARTAEWVTKQSVQLAALQEQESELWAEYQAQGGVAPGEGSERDPGGDEAWDTSDPKPEPARPKAASPKKRPTGQPAIERELYRSRAGNLMREEW